jgi:hypothetical protein
MRRSGKPVWDAVGGSQIGRIGLVFAGTLTVFLLSIAVSYAIADDDTPPSPPPAVEASVPGTAEILGAYDAARQREAAREEELEEPRFVAAREASRHAYADLPAAEAEKLLQTVFPQILEALNADPARYMSDAKLDRSLGEGDAVVTSEGRTALLEGSVPVQAEEEDGDLGKVDLTWREPGKDSSPRIPSWT